MKISAWIGFEITEEVNRGKFMPKSVERRYAGEVLKMYGNRSQTTDQVNDEIGVSNRLSIVADPFAYHNFQTMKYIEWMGALWCIKDVEVQPPRLILSIGGVYNGERGEKTGRAASSTPDGT